VPPPAVMGAQLACSFGLAPSTLVVVPTARVMVEKRPVASIMDMKPFVNIVPFGMCSSLANPTVAASTAAALGVLTPMPCVPVPTAPWSPGAPRTMVAGVPALTAGCMTMCAYGGVITVTNPGSTMTQTS
jgi:hypothetical protein